MVIQLFAEEGKMLDVKCFHFERSTRNWKRVNLLENFDSYNSNLKMFGCDSQE